MDVAGIRQVGPGLTLAACGIKIGDRYKALDFRTWS